MHHVVGTELTKSLFGKNRSDEVLTPERGYIDSEYIIILRCTTTGIVPI